MSIPASIRLTPDGYKALQILESTTQKKRVDIMSEALVEKAKGTTATPAVKCRLLDPSEILTLQSELAALEKLHADNRRTVKIRTSDKAATEKIIKLVEKIDTETKELEAKRLAIGRLAKLAESLTREPTLIKTLIGWVEKRIQNTTPDQTAQLKIYALELEILKYLYEA
jgi:hypothetical protein